MAERHEARQWRRHDKIMREGKNIDVVEAMRRSIGGD